MAEAIKTGRGCTAIGWSNGVIGQNQDMSIKLSGYGAIWKSSDIICMLPHPCIQQCQWVKILLL
ncbi:hypothetical protein QE177_15230 (plasmid) [Arsenophonus sp. aPb]|uniref:hypothetical protein n=1 Tax=Arsenophonus sp. aPb TaxID=3041619 RepID=UPI002468B718|nr:hypothetical protein [Arsenophonus sp. aPb]WGL99851.1 hypothetical protein QE177_15230 [Arsenophonus sp. aPb]